MSAICVCGQGLICDRTCAGALAKQQECAERGHLTDVAIYEHVWGERLPAPTEEAKICHRCGDTGQDG